MKRYARVSIDGGKYLAHRLAWFYVHGAWPASTIDHINGDKLDNRIANLREVDHRTNCENVRVPRKSNSTGLLGVTAYSGRFRASICTNGAVRWLGTFDTPEAAHAAYLDSKRRLHAGCTI